MTEPTIPERIAKARGWELRHRHTRVALKDDLLAQAIVRSEGNDPEEFTKRLSFYVEFDPENNPAQWAELLEELGTANLEFVLGFSHTSREWICNWFNAPRIRHKNLGSEICLAWLAMEKAK